MKHKKPHQSDLASILRQLQDKTSVQLPPVDKWNPDFCGDIDLVIKRDGSWHYAGSPIGRQRLVKLFSTVLKKENSSYFLVTPVEKLGIQVEDAPFLAIRMRIEQSKLGKVIIFEDNCDNQIVLSQDNPLWVVENPVSQEPAPYIKVRAELNALIHRNLFYELVAMAEQQTLDGVEHLGVYSAGQFFSLGQMPEAC